MQIHANETIEAATNADTATTERKPVMKRVKPGEGGKAKQAAPKAKAPAKAKAAPSPAKADAPATVTTIADLALAYPAHLAAVGKSATTQTSYASDLRVAARHFGENTKLSGLTKKKILAYFTSAALTRNRHGAPKNPITTAKLRRVFRLAMTWADEAGRLAKLDLPTKSDLAD